MLPSITSILTNADSNTQLGPQPRHPKNGQYQGMAHSAASKGFSREQDAELADSSKGKGTDDPNSPAEEIEDEGNMIGQGDRPQKPRVTGGVPEGKPLNNARRDKRRDDEDDDEDDDDDEDEDTYNARPDDTAASGQSTAIQSAGEAGAEKYAPNKGTLGKAIGRVASTVDHPIQSAVGQARLAIHHPGTFVSAGVKSVVHPIKHSADYGIGKPQEYHATAGDAASQKGHFGGEPMFEDTPHDQTLRAAGASLAHPASREHAMGAMDASMAGDSKMAARLHKKSAREHLKEAEAHMKDGNSEQADAHLQAASMHHRAATQHMGCDMARNAEERDSSGRWVKAAGIVGGAATGALLGGAFAGPMGAILGAGAGGSGAALGYKQDENRNLKGRLYQAHKNAEAAHAGAMELLGKYGDASQEASDALHMHDTEKARHAKEAESLKSYKLNSKGSNMALNRKSVIDFIVVNCDCTPTGGPEATRNALKQKTDAELLSYKSNLLALINANAKAEGSFADTKGKGGKGMMAGGMGHGADDEVTYKEDEDDSTEEEPEQAEDAFTGKGTNNQRSGPMTDEEWMAAAPPRVREIVRNAEKRDNQEKTDLHRRITLIANGQHPHRKALILNELQGIKTKTGLQRLLGLVMPMESITDNEEVAQVFAGAGAPQASLIDNQAQDDILVSPTINWSEEHADARNGKARSTTTSSSGR